MPNSFNSLSKTGWSLELMQKNLFSVIGVVIVKLVALPLLGLTLFLIMDVKPDDYLPALILLATPTATVAYVMAGDMGGDSEFSAAAISTSTIFSTITFVVWLAVTSHL